MQTSKLQLIGKGLFSKVYRLNEEEVLIVSEDFCKEAQALWIRSNLVPSLERTGDNDYKMPYYARVKSLKNSLLPDQYALYMELRKFGTSFVKNDHNRLDILRAEFETIKNPEVREDLLEVLDDLSNYGTDIGFEISPRNVAVKDGKLVLLDCFFIISQMLRVRKEKAVKYARNVY